MAFKRRSDADIRASLYDDIDHIEHTPYQCKSHSPVAGMMHVHAEDLEFVAASRGKVECDTCDMVYRAGKGWVSP